MASKEQAYNKGYQRGLNGQGAGDWGDYIGDSLTNEKGSNQARLDGYYAGKRKKMERDAERRNR